MSRVLFHIDLNSFYASVEMAHDPSLRGKPLAIAGNAKERKGIVVTCSYEARAKGVHAPMPLWEAKRKCPELLVMEPNFPRYRAASQGFFQLLHEWNALIEPVSIDEGYMEWLDEKDKKNARNIAYNLQGRVKRELDLPCSIGVAPNRFLAKMASDFKKPMGITVLRKRDVQSVLWPLPVREMHGVGEKTSTVLNSLGFMTIEDLAKADRMAIRTRLGKRGPILVDRANGIDNRPVDPEAAEQRKSIGHSTTLPKDTTDVSTIEQTLHMLTEKGMRRLQEKGYVALGVQVMIRYGNRATVTRQVKLEQPTQQISTLYKAAQQLFFANWNDAPVRLLGVTCHPIAEKEESTVQIDLFAKDDDQPSEEVYTLIESIRDQFGKGSISRGFTKRKRRE
ncbi:DNA polymerase IV [Bacillus fonticola]|uniref:DNA polymerase IV n=1 Tax=Bacillus fonticola TaxID=2728853 RepID=UPI001473F50A|nr:DNA polymerase IV [Bacillus fonticola]